MMRNAIPACCAALLSLLLWTSGAAAESWPAYLDYAYVYSSAEPDALRARLSQYGKEAGIPLEDYAAKEFGPGALVDDQDETRLRRAANANKQPVRVGFALLAGCVIREGDRL